MARATRDAYGHLLETELYKNPRIVVLDADLHMESKCLDRTIQQYADDIWRIKPVKH